MHLKNNKTEKISLWIFNGVSSKLEIQSINFILPKLMIKRILSCLQIWTKMRIINNKSTASQGKNHSKKDIKPLMKEIYEHKENYKTEASNDALFQKHFPNIQNKNFEDTYMFDKACQKTCVNQRCMDTWRIKKGFHAQWIHQRSQNVWHCRSFNQKGEKIKFHLQHQQ